MPLFIRSETEADFDAIRALVRDAFATLPQAEGDEEEFVTAMRGHKGYIPELALVAERKGEIVGYAMLTETVITGPEGGPPVLLLAPLCVTPKRQSRGIGAALLHEAFHRAVGLGYDAVFLAGNPRYYRRFGFHSTGSFGIGHRMPVPDKYIMARELIPGALARRSGVILLTGHTTCASALATPVKDGASDTLCPQSTSMA
jgi:putative acetyltransferase